MSWSFDEKQVLVCAHPDFRNLDCDDCRRNGSTCINVCIECGYDWGFIEMDREYTEEMGEK